MKFYFDVRGDKIVAREDYRFVEGNENTYEAVFSFDEAWNPDMARQCICEVNKKRYVMPIISGSCLLPEMVKGSSYIGVIGVLTDNDLVARISTKMIPFGVSRGAYNGEVGEEFKSAAEVWEIYLSDMEKSRQEAEAAADRAEEQADRIKNLDVSAEEGIQAAVKKTETEDGISLKFTLPKGEKGDEGPKGDTGERGPQGIQGPKGDKGDQGDRGPAGEKGADGYTPKKGVDYFTPEDIEELDIPSKEYIENIAYEASSAKTEAMENTTFRLEAEPEIEKLRKDVDGHQRWLEDNDLKHLKYEEDLAQVKTEIGEIKPAISIQGNVDMVSDVIPPNTELYYGIVSVSIAADVSGFVEGSISALHFSTPAEVPADYSTFPENIKFKGDSVEDERFVPEENMRYTIVFDFDGTGVIGYVSGVSL